MFSFIDFDRNLVPRAHITFGQNQDLHSCMVLAKRGVGPGDETVSVSFSTILIFSSLLLALEALPLAKYQLKETEFTDFRINNKPVLL